MACDISIKLTIANAFWVETLEGPTRPDLAQFQGKPNPIVTSGSKIGISQ